MIAGRYELERELGRGGMAVVWLARDTELDRPVAVKILAEHLAGDPEFRDRFLREARIAGRLAHPNLVRVFDVGEDDGLPFIVMEYVEGRTLEGVHVEAPEATRLGLQLCAGLEQAHAAGVVHRDLKPGNLLLRADGTLKIADFGIARAVEETRMTQAGTVLGTLAYLAPEQAAGHEVTTAADIYSLGVVLRNLIEGPTPRGLGETLSACVERDPARRPTVSQVASALRGEETTRVAPTGVTRVTPTRHRPRIRLWRLAVPVVLALVLVLWLGITQLPGGKAPAPRRVEPVPHGATAGEEARNLAAWLRLHTSRG